MKMIKLKEPSPVTGGNSREELSSLRAGEPQRFAKDVIWVALAQIINSLLFGIVTLPAFTKTYSSEMFGVWNQVNYTVILLSPCIGLQLGLAAVRFLSGDVDKSYRRRVLGTMLLAILIVSGLVLIAANIWTAQLSLLIFNSPDYTFFVRLTFWWVCVNALFNFFISYFRARNKMRFLSIRQVAVALVTLGLVIGLASNGFEIEWVIISILIVQVLFTLAFWVMIIRETGIPVPAITGLKSYLAYSIPQIPGGILLWIIQSSDRFFITRFLGLSQTGIYSSSCSLAALTGIFYAPLSFVLFPAVSKLWEQGRFTEVKLYLEQSVRLFLTLAIPASIGIGLLSQPLLQLLTTDEYLAGMELVLLLTAGTLFLGIYQINVHIILLMKNTKVLPLMIGAASVTSALINVFLIPLIGIHGAAISNIASFALLSVLVTLWARRVINYHFDFKYILKVIGASLVMAAALYFLEVEGVWGIALGIIAGSVVYGTSLYLLRAFSRQDRSFIKGMLKGVIPGVRNHG